MLGGLKEDVLTQTGARRQVRLDTVVCGFIPLPRSIPWPSHTCQVAGSAAAL
jgi:hypothetical protein